MTAQTRVASSLLAIPTLCVFLLGVTIPAAAKDDWQSDLHKWVVSNDTNPNCKVRYIPGMYRPDMGDQPAWGMMTEKMFKWFAKDGVKLAPSVCPASRNTKDKAAYRILFSVSPMKTVTRTTHGSEVQTVDTPFSANINSRTSYSDGSTANSTATINGQQTTTVVVPTETTISKSSVGEYMYTYRVQGDQLELISSDSVVFSRVAASGSGEDATGAELGAGIGNLIGASGERHRENKFYEEALKAISADAQDSAAKPNAHPGNRAAEEASANTQGTPAAITPIPPSSAPPSPAQLSKTESVSPTEDVATLKGMAVTGYPDAQYILATGYLTGHGVPQDYAQAAIWYRKAAEQGFAEAQSALGGLYINGIGVPQDYAEAYFWLDLAAAGNVGGLNSENIAKSRDLAASHLDSAVLLRTQERARNWFEDHPAKPR